MDDLVKAAESEGKLNVIALPPDWANYGNIIKAFEAKYDIEITSDQPDGASQDEINAATQLEGSDRAPDVFDLGQSVALANTDMFAPYQVATFGDIPAEFKDPDGAWVNDYGGFMSVGYNSNEVPEVTSMDDLLGPDFKGKVALNGDPTAAGAAFSGVVMASVANGGSADDIKPGVDYFADLKDAGNFLPVDPTSATIESGQTPVVIDWDYLNAAESSKVDGWKVFVPGGRADRRLLLPGDQRRRTPPGRRAALGGVPLQRRGPEPLARGRGTPRARRRHGRRRHHRQDLVRRAAGGVGHARHPDERADGEDGGVPRRQLGQGRRLSVADTAPLAGPAPGPRRTPDGPVLQDRPVRGPAPFLATSSSS